MKPIKTEEDYNLALKRLDEILLADVNSPEGDEAHILSILIEEYENENYEIEPPDPIEAIKIRLEEMQISNFDLINIFGNEQHKYDI